MPSFPEPPAGKKTARARTAAVLLDCLLVLILASALVKPFFKAKYFSRWESIESTFIADARFLNAHWPHPRWQPLWYGGTRFDYIYPPALRYGTALIARVAPVEPVKAYHIYAAFFYCFGIAGVYFFTRVVSGSRAAGWLAAAGAALLSPSFLFLRNIREDAPYWIPQRLGVLVRYGEGPHISALGWIPVMLAFAWLALRTGRLLPLAAAALAGAMVASNNFYGATALAMLYPILVWSIWVTHREPRTLYHAAAIPVLTYGLAAFWLVPSYFTITTANMKFVSQPGSAWSVWILLAAAAAYILASYRLARGRRDLAYPVFLAGAVLFFSLNVIGNAAFQFRVVGEPARWVPELDLVLILATVEALRRLWNLPAGRARPAVRLVCALVVAAAFSTAAGFVRHAWTYYPIESNYQARVEYRMQDWMARHLPNARALAAGSVRFWYNAWNDLAQFGGGSEQGIENPLVMPAQWQVLLGDDPRLAVDWLVAFGTDAVIVHDKNSPEHYHDFAFPYKFAGVLPVLYDTGHGDVIYQVPRRPGLARVVDTARLAALRPVASVHDAGNLRAYVDAVERGTDTPAGTAWHGTDALAVRARTAAGQQVLVQVTYDPAWRAYEGTASLAIRKDAMGFLLLDTPPGDHDIRLVFSLPFENAVGRGITALSLAALAALVVLDIRRRRRAVHLPAVVAEK